tara:strand:- start:12244 stop:12990 length:747 start_codon:yes stop_codon:yes gene_type:complete
MASVYEVYNIVKDLTNKDERGMITPAQFNSFASVAQTKVYNTLFAEFQDNKRFAIRQVSAGRDKNRVKQLQEDLSVFSKSLTLSSPSTDLGTFTKPDDLARIISLTTKGDWFLDQTTSSRIQLVYDEEKIDMILQSSLSVPSEDNPVALVSNKIEVFPTSIRKIKIRYYKQPEGVTPAGVKTASLPKFGYTVDSNGAEVWDSATTIDFELPEHYVADLVMEIAKMTGINMRQADVYQYAVAEQNKDLK